MGCIQVPGINDQDGVININTDIGQAFYKDAPLNDFQLWKN